MEKFRKAALCLRCVQGVLSYNCWRIKQTRELCLQLTLPSLMQELVLVISKALNPIKTFKHKLRKESVYFEVKSNILLLCISICKIVNITIFSHIRNYGVCQKVPQICEMRNYLKHAAVFCLVRYIGTSAMLYTPAVVLKNSLDAAQAQCSLSKLLWNKM